MSRRVCQTPLDMFLVWLRPCNLLITSILPLRLALLNPTGGGGGGRTLMQQAPAAIDAVGMTELFAPMAAAAAATAADAAAPAAQRPAQQELPGASRRHHLQLSYERPLAGSTEGALGGSNGSGSCTQAGAASRLMSALGGSGGGSGSAAPVRLVSGPTAAATAAVNSLLSELGATGPAQQQGAGAPPAGQPAPAGRPVGRRMFEPRPWERAALAASARPCPPRAPVVPAAAGTAGNVVGPVHLVAQHAERQRQRSASAELEHAQHAQQGDQQARAGGADGPEQQEQRGASPLAEAGGLQQQGDAAAADGKARSDGKAGQRAESINAFLTRLREEMPKVRGRAHSA